MKILILVNMLTYGGAERVAALWANGFAQHGHQVSVCTCKKNNIPDTYSLDCKIKRYNIYNWILSKLSRFGLHPMSYKLKGIIKAVNPNVIICVQGHWAQWAYNATNGMNIPIINTMHNAYERPMYAPMSHQAWREKFIENNKYTAVTVLTEADYKCIEGKLRNVYVLPNPLTFSPSNTVPAKEKIILAAGRFNDWHYKGFDLLIKAWGQIANKNIDWKLYIAGSGKKKRDFEFLKQMAIENNVEDRIVFPGFVEMLPLFQKASIFVLSSRYEAFGMVLTEAMSQGCACIACDYKGRQSEIIKNENEGITIPVDDVKSIALAINKLTNNDELRNKLQQGALIRSHFYDINRTMNRWETILSMVINK